jgi:hypothetical protein
MSVSITLEPAVSPSHVATARELFREYEDAIGVNLEYQGFTAELANLPSPYLPPEAHFSSRRSMAPRLAALHCADSTARPVR